MLLNVINKHGNELLCYVGLGHVKNRGAKGNLEARLKIDDHTKENFSSFVKFTASEANIQEIHALVTPDLDLRYLAQEYEDVQESTMHNDNPKALLQNLCANSNKTESVFMSDINNW